MCLIISRNENKYNLNFKLFVSLIDKYEENANRHD